MKSRAPGQGSEPDHYSGRTSPDGSFIQPVSLSERFLPRGEVQGHSAITLSSEHNAKWDSLRVAGVYLYLVGLLGGYRQRGSL
jgi:hypothetical protein